MRSSLPTCRCSDARRDTGASSWRPRSAASRSRGARDGGTNAVSMRPPGRMTTHFGEPGSAAVHERAAWTAGADAHVLDRPGLAFDVDTPEDLARWRQLTLGYKASAEQFAPQELARLLRSPRSSGSISSRSPTTSSPGGTGRPCPDVASLARRARAGTEPRVAGTERADADDALPPVDRRPGFGTLGCLAPGRVFLGVGTGRGDERDACDRQRVAGAKERRLRLRGGDRAHPPALDGRAGDVRGRLLPHRQGDDLRPADRAGAVYVAASGPLAAKLAGRVGDGFICTSGKQPELYEELLDAVAEGAEAAGRDATRSCA